jgi:hypothetical protein
MNELVELKEGWGQTGPPSSAAYSSARAALLEQITMVGNVESAPKRRRGGRLAWLIGGTAVTASLAAAVAFAVVPGSTPAGQLPGQVSGNQSYDQLTAQQILLAAATVAQNKPATTGKYWYNKTQYLMDSKLQTTDGWITRDGDGYGYLSEYGGAVLLEPHSALTVGNAFTLADIEQLPTDPAALIAWIKDSIDHPATPPKYPLGSGDHEPSVAVGGKTPEAEKPGLTANTLINLLYRVPAPPAVRAAAFRALASLPNVTKLGEQDGGQALRITYTKPDPAKYPDHKVPAGAGQTTVVIDPATATLISETDYTGTQKILTAEWTNTMPKIVKVPPKK